jgi:hypothetical protein
MNSSMNIGTAGRPAACDACGSVLASLVGDQRWQAVMMQQQCWRWQHGAVEQRRGAAVALRLRWSVHCCGHGAGVEWSTGWVWRAEGM